MNYYDSEYYTALKDFFNEPDYWTGQHEGYALLAQRNFQKAWCGYVGIPLTHPHAKLSYGDRVPVKTRNILIENQSPISIMIEAMAEDDGKLSIDMLYNCPGGITWAAEKEPFDNIKGPLWWFGFDCLHYNDLSPHQVFQNAVEGRSHWLQATYRNLEFVKAALISLAEQLKEQEK